MKIISYNINFISILKAKTKVEVWEIGGQSLSLWGEWTAWKIAYVGKIEKDQVESYAKRRNKDMQYTERWLSPALGYDA